MVALADSVAAQGPLDILINNAAQTVRRSPGAYTHLADAELAPLPDRPLPQITTFGRTSSAHPRRAGRARVTRADEHRSRRRASPRSR